LQCQLTGVRSRETPGSDKLSSPTDAVAYRFGRFEVDARTGELRKQDARLRIRGRPIDILLILVASPGEVVTRDQLRSRLWPADTFVDFDHGLHSAVNRLREALGDSADNPRFIETLPRRGYRFIAPVTVLRNAAQSAVPVASPVAVAEPEGPVVLPPVSSATLVPPVPLPPPAPVARSRIGFPAIALALATTLVVGGLVFWRSRPMTGAGGKMTIAVLPFENLSGDPQQDYFSDGFTEEMITELGMLEPDRLVVIGRTTSMLYKNAKKTVGQIGQELGATYLLDGSVRRSGNRVRIAAQLVETAGMTNLWTESYERDVTDVLAIQSEVARQIARSLTLALTPSAKPSKAANSSSFAAYELYMRGRFFREQATEDGARKAIEYYERAIAIDPNYAAAYAGIADAYRLLGAPGWEVDSPSTLLPRAKTAAERALALDPASPEAHAVVAMIKFNYDWDLAGAEREIKEALRLNPSFAQAHQYDSGVLMTMKRPDEAIAAAQRAMELDPLAATASTSLGVRYYYANRCAEAIAAFTKTLETTPGFAVAHWGLGQCYRMQKRFPEQIEQLRSAVQLSGNSAYMRAHLAYGYAVAGDRDQANALRRELTEEGKSRYLAPYHMALIAAGLGETDDVVRWLEKAFADRSGWLMFLPVEPEFGAMRQAPGFQRLLARIASEAPPR
jgi:TolB-like protein/DNA-binding winged helix-turn-helix (wHTH) protein/Flp pilus assembly protein TadD